MICGEQRGRELGFPTANLAVSVLQALPSWGVYVACAQYDDQFWPAIVNIGKRPTFNSKKNSKKITVEAHLLNFDKNIYQEKLKISFLEKIRPEQKFRSKEELQAQICRDLARAQQILTEKFKSG